MEKYFYEINLSWKSERTGMAGSHGLKEIEVVSPRETPVGKKNNWTPEHLLGASVSSGFMTTFLDVAEKAKLEIFNYQSQCFVRLEKIKGKYIPTELLIRPAIKIQSEQFLLKAQKCIEEAEGICPIRNAVKISVEVHPQFEFINKGAKLKS